MSLLVSLQQARDHLRSDDTADDSDLELKVLAASQVVLDYIQGDAVDGLTDTDGELLTDTDGLVENVPYRMQAATLLLIGYLYRNRDGDPDKDFGENMLPLPVKALLSPYRDPSCA